MSRGNGRRREVDAELEHHIALRVEALVREGVPEEEARRRVAREAGDLERARRYCARMDAARERAGRRRARLAGWAVEVRSALRALARRPGGPIAAVGVLAAALALNTVAFSLVEGVLLAPLPLPAAERVVVVRERPVAPGRPAAGVSWPALARWREGSRTLEGAVGWLSTSRAFADGDEPVYLEGASVSEGFLDFTGAPILAGRGLSPADHRPGAEPALVLGEGLWRRAFGGDRGVVGRRLTLDGVPHRVVGVAGGEPWPEGAEYWVPLEAASPDLREVWGARILSVLARLRPGVGAADAAAEMGRLTADIPDGAEWRAELTPLDEDLRRGARRPLLLLQGAVALVLLIACANVGILLLARGLARREELAVRKALGGGAVRVAAGGVAEALALAAVAGVAGLAAAGPALSAVLARLPAELPRQASVAIDPAVALFGLGLALATGLAAGLVPALQALRTPAAGTLRAAASPSGGAWAGRLRSGLVVAQVATSVVLVALAGVLLRSFVATVRQDPGFRAEGVVTVELTLPPARYPDAEDARAFVRELLPRLEALPGAEAAAAGVNLPITGSSMTSPVEVGDAGTTPEPAQVAWVTPGYFRVMGTPVVAGRAFGAADAEDGRPVAMVDETFAERFLPGLDPLGARARSYFGGQAPREVVGVAGAVRHGGLTEAPVPVFYEPFLQAPRTGFFVLLRSSAPPGTALADARRVLAELDPALPVRSVATLEQRVGRSVAGPRFYATVLGAFALLSLALTVVGFTSVLAHLVGERRREIGIRMALGASRPGVRRMVVRRALALTGAGLVLGLGGALMATRALSGLLFRVAPADPVVLAALPVVMVAAAAAAAWLPARRATAVDPAVTLRE